MPDRTPMLDGDLADSDEGVFPCTPIALILILSHMMVVFSDIYPYRYFSLLFYYGLTMPHKFKIIST
jgi:hypothetical protein